METDIRALQILPEAEREPNEWPCLATHFDDDDIDDSE